MGSYNRENNFDNLTAEKISSGYNKQQEKYAKQYNNTKGSSKNKNNNSTLYSNDKNGISYQTIIILLVFGICAGIYGSKYLKKKNINPFSLGRTQPMRGTFEYKYFKCF